MVNDAGKLLVWMARLSALAMRSLTWLRMRSVPSGSSGSRMNLRSSAGMLSGPTPLDVRTWGPSVGMAAAGSAHAASQRRWTLSQMGHAASGLAEQRAGGRRADGPQIALRMQLRVRRTWSWAAAGAGVAALGGTARPEAAGGSAATGTCCRADAVVAPGSTPGRVSRRDSAQWARAASVLSSRASVPTRVWSSGNSALSWRCIWCASKPRARSMLLDTSAARRRSMRRLASLLRSSWRLSSDRRAACAGVPGAVALSWRLARRVAAMRATRSAGSGKPL